jgi:hypothetical protein
MGMVMLGLFALNPNGVNGGVMQMINHGIYSGALFLLVGIIYERRHTRNVAEFGGLSHVMPGYAAIFLGMVMTAIGLPLLAVFISEFLALRGAFEANPYWSAWAAPRAVDRCLSKTVSRVHSTTGECGCETSQTGLRDSRTERRTTDFTDPLNRFSQIRVIRG